MTREQIRGDRKRRANIESRIGSRARKFRRLVDEIYIQIVEKRHEKNERTITRDESADRSVKAVRTIEEAEKGNEKDVDSLH